MRNNMNIFIRITANSIEDAKEMIKQLNSIKESHPGVVVNVEVEIKERFIPTCGKTVLCPDSNQAAIGTETPIDYPEYDPIAFAKDDRK